MNCIICGKRLSASNTSGIGRDCSQKVPKLLAIMRDMADDERRNGYEKSACGHPGSSATATAAVRTDGVQVVQEHIYG